ncbi:zinc ABC transporter ATPase [Microbacterium sp. SORGH_AS_0888]|uniref:zinc ABC transporter ATPase n=1 Tax=Microbacterium sp. SORGH_AS_0888 TaxID=3041791 RepID=UPI00278A422E|nr:zinc ABC transporter ATPase [Microbacterium sp. SORGH_AS_0888]MDQ1129938.1 hypothetical protein [Microbacterium sp. SORGH_AS_0888]
MGVEGQNEDWEGIIREMIADATESAPTEPGVYKMPCGECIVDFFLNAEGQERWLIAGDARSYTRETVAIARHGEHPWRRLYTLAEAAAEIATLAASREVSADRLIEELVETTEDREAERIARARLAMDSEPIEDVADRFGIDLKDL